MKMPVHDFTPVQDSRKLRKAMGLDQARFWGAVGVTQSGGSRYEGSRRMPKPVRALLNVLVSQLKARERQRKNRRRAKK